MRGMSSRIVVAVAMLHLVVAALFSTHVPVERSLPDFLERPLRLYGDYTGARTRFDFFAPEVSSQARARFVVTRADGKVEERVLDTDNREADQRIAAMMTYMGDRTLRGYVMHAWCVYLLSRDPSAMAVEAHLEMLEVPTMAEARAGARPKWAPLGRYALRRDQV